MMRFSPVLKLTSPHCLPSPDGRSIATLLPPASIGIRAVESLDLVRTIKLPANLAASATTFVWSASSERILLATADEIHIFSATGTGYHATIRNPSPAAAKSTFVDFGATDAEALVISAHGIKLSLFNLTSSRAVEIANPKFYTTSSAARGFSFRPSSRHLALLTRTSGKDTISIHAPETRDVLRSWSPDLVDAQGLAWTPDGRWLVVWESAAQGHRVSFFTPDGHRYRDWCGSVQKDEPGDMHERLGPGARLVVLSPNSQYAAIGDYSRRVCLLHTSNMTTQLLLRHPSTAEPKDTLQIWQEQMDASRTDTPTPGFVRASQPVMPPARAASGNAQQLRSGPGIMLFDRSTSLLAVVLEDAPSTLWIWDVAASELRAVLMFHSEISGVEWHPKQAELLFVRCGGDSYDGVVFAWDPLSGGPRTIDFRSHLPQAKASGRSATTWLNCEPEAGVLFYADTRCCLLGSLADTDSEVLPWGAEALPTATSTSRSQAAASPTGPSAEQGDERDSDMDEGASQLEDTFEFKNFSGA